MYYNGEALKERGKQLFKDSGMTQEELANAIGISPSSIAGYCSDGTTGTPKNPRADTLYLIAKYFNVTSDWLLGLSDNKHYENVDISERTGLSDEAIEILDFFKKHGDMRCADCINHLLIQEEIHPISKFNYFEKDQNFQQIFENEIQGIGEKNKAFDEKNLVPILTKIWDYIRITNLKNIFVIDMDGNVHEHAKYIPETGTYEQTHEHAKERNFGFDSTIISSNRIIEQIFIADINKRLELLRDEYLTTHKKQEGK